MNRLRQDNAQSTFWMQSILHESCCHSGVFGSAGICSEAVIRQTANAQQTSVFRQRQGGSPVQLRAAVVFAWSAFDSDTGEAGLATLQRVRPVLSRDQFKSGLAQSHQAAYWRSHIRICT